MDYKYKLYGAIYGDIVGRLYEYKFEGDLPTTLNMFPKGGKISDDSLMTLASAYSILNNIPAEEAYKLIGSKYGEEYGYGKNFIKWIKGEECFTNSYGNGSIMRISPFIWANKLEDIDSSIECTHNHPSSYLAAKKLCELYASEDTTSKIENAHFTEGFFINAFDTYQIVEKLFFLGNQDLEINVSNAIKIGGDTDTNASILGELINYKNRNISEKIITFVEEHLDDYLLGILKEFNEKY